MSCDVIETAGLSKRYRVGERERYLVLRDVLARAVKAPLQFWRKPAPDFLWALKDVSFGVKKSEVVGLIGRNGAGKTTLLKVLARITRPTAGHAQIRGRVGSLLEVGTGFHPELTGRENAYLSGAILGMRKAEIDRKFDEIVAFAGVERFLDTALKHYSAGMQMRLAFAVAAHLEPEILLVDEVLAVGDLEFQKKSLGKMQEVSRSGRTIIFVSHQMNQIRRLCERVLWIDGGQIRREGRAGEVIADYEAAQLDLKADDGNSGSCFLRWSACGNGNVVRESMQETTLHFYVRLRDPVQGGHFGVAILGETNSVLVGWGFDNVNIPTGLQEITIRMPALPLRPGAYTLTCSLFTRGNNLTGGQLLEEWYAFPALVVDTPPLAHPQERWAGLLNLPAELHVETV